MSPLLLIGAALVGLVIVLALDRLALALLRPAHRPPGREPSDVGLVGEDWTIPGQPPLKGWVMKGGSEAGPVVVLAHGWGANTGVVLPLGAAMAAAAFRVVAYDVRGHGRSDRAPMVSVRQFRDDAMRVVKAVVTAFPGRPVVLAGHSLGGAAAILAAAEGAPVSGLVLVACPYDVFATIGRYLQEKGLPGRLLIPLLRPFWRLRVGQPARRLHPGLALEKLAVPTLVIQPAADTRVPPEEGTRLASAAGLAVSIVPGAGHTNVLQHPRTAELCLDFTASFAGRSDRGYAPGP